MTHDRPHPLLKSTDIDRLEEEPRTHQFNDNAVRLTRSLGDLLGMKDMGIHLVRVQPGRESTEFHKHSEDEEFLYILSGRGMAAIGTDTIEVGPGDFMGFVADSLPHCMSNPFGEDLVYLMCGTRKPVDICDYPKIGRRMYRIHGVKEYADWNHIHKL